MTSPVFSRTRGSCPSALRSAQRSVVRRSCQTIAWWSARPEIRSQTAVVSRWFVIPIAAMSRPRSPASRSARWTVATVEPQMSSRSCSTQPGFGKICRNSWFTRARSASRLSRMRTVVPVVPWSIAIT